MVGLFAKIKESSEEKVEINYLLVDKLIKQALAEDIGTGDLTTSSLVSENAQTKAIIHAKEEGVIAGLLVAQRVFAQLDENILFTQKVKEGTKVAKGDILAVLEGNAHAILMGERLALNLLQRMSGIATQTANFVHYLAESKTQIADTRKTTPGLRMLEKYAVKIGGGKNHRFGLYDAVLIKDNHIKVVGGIKQAINLARKNVSHTVKIEVEVEELTSLQEALEARADIIMLDNMSLENMKKAVEITNGRAILEASGNMTEERIALVARTGVDIISVGALTHSVKALDISLDIGQIKEVR